MAEISAAIVKELRERSGAGMMSCKKALQETGGDIEAAIEYLRKQGEASASKRAGRVAKEGIIGTQIQNHAAVILELNSETDFVSRNDDFRKFHSDLLGVAMEAKPENVEAFENVRSPVLGNRTVKEGITEKIAVIGENIGIRRVTTVYETPDTRVFTYIHMGGKIGILLLLKASEAVFANEQVATLGKDLCMQVAAANPTAVSRENIAREKIEAELAIYREAAKIEGKPEKILDRIAQGKLDKYFEENCLIEQPYIRDPDVKVSKLIADTAKAVGSEISVVTFVRYQLGGQ
ncbi:MAG: translation elongation factor Ts [Candidatus Raymondbacteria bacterium RifOxyA12_full_50_37]|uniref:Elongation factor Ts n=1 Tax=Candidatus Raymondbacteria bacterium RIFOXYD12_FULL_49_13 TaxID=1817890 RepID=A0A1F7FAV6_UNCRA|nr:MAG: translation elongation factor Ts [Candidatus Raymondbacteria bacterium RifOxyA12_full_50_37]OGJ92389.1 MAG: translation elongation factor Ts [Candidatus Raymondbacteria bacterium RIFOXYA2_FULL_49_16]OGJ98348.1 MAG: translation elongation factor Ts [Candidatus Raymondbacteria bacterium RifOxyC12_full_50_8]OGJ99370.1 MAG: translation elongation factor Ts [Candidatus Raymondbacteria bacterium RIFOXYC2_FULL_50_21]OGK03616.1 MAG: translation elongation factor Ts [Candidatus Raymondbacteria b